MKVVVIGGGPAGMMSAISAAKSGDKVVLLEKNNILGKKIISVGTFLFRMAAVTDKDVVMTGITLPQSSVLIKYDDVEALSLANDDGVFTYSYSDPLTIGTIVTFNCKTHNDFDFWEAKC